MWQNVKGMLALPEAPNQRAAAKQGLLGFGATLLGGRGDFGGILGDGLMAGTQGYQGALAQQQQAALQRAQQQRVDLENRETQAKLDEPAQFAQIMSGFGGNSSVQESGPLSAVPQMSVPGAVGAQARGPIQPRPSEQQYAEAMDAYRRYTAAGKPIQAKIYFDIAKGLQPRLKEQRALTVDGKRVIANVYEDGRTEQVDGFAPDLEKLHFANTGGATVGLDAFSGQQVGSVRNTQSPDSAASVAATMRGQNMSDARARDLNEITRQGQRSQIINDPTQGPIVVDKGTAQARQVTLNGQAVPGEAVAKREAAGKNLIPLLKSAASLLDGATGSYLGAGADQAARLIGTSTAGAQNIAQLKVLEGNIMMAQPRMEGPQSNLDVELYRQMAAKIGDPTVPASEKKAALKGVYELYMKYDPDAGKEGNSFVSKVKSLKDLPKKPAAGGHPADIGNLLNKYGAK